MNFFINKCFIKQFLLELVRMQIQDNPERILNGKKKDICFFYLESNEKFSGQDKWMLVTNIVTLVCEIAFQSPW